MRIILLLLLLSTTSSYGVTAFMNELLNRPTALTGRQWLLITNAQDGIVAGTNVVFTTNSSGKIKISFSGGVPGSGTVTSFSSGNLSPLFTTSVATATTTPALSFSLTAQNANLVFAGPSSAGPTAPTFRSLVATDIPSLSYVSSVGLSAPSIFSVSGSPVTSSGTLTFTLATQSANTFLGGPTSGGAATPTFRTIALDNLNDVTAPSPAAGDIIAYSGSAWTNGPPSASASSLTVKEQDGSPSVANVTEIKVSNGTLTDNTGGSVSITTGGSSSGSSGILAEQTNSVITMRTVNGDVTDGTVSTFNGFGDALAFSNTGGTGAGVTRNYLTGTVIGSYSEMRTASTSGAVFVLTSGAAINAILPYNGGSFYFQTYIIPLTTNSARIATGAFGSASLFAAMVGDSVVTNSAIFRYSSAAGDTNWMAVCSDGTNVTTLNTGVAVAPNEAYMMQIQKTATPTVIFTINRTNITIATSNAPNNLNQASDKMFAFSGVATLATGVKTNLVRYLSYSYDWPNK